jgi:hypothetical protein
MALLGDRWFLLAGTALMALAVGVSVFTTRPAPAPRTPALPDPVRV